MRKFFRQITVSVILLLIFAAQIALPVTAASTTTRPLVDGGDSGDYSTFSSFRNTYTPVIDQTTDSGPVKKDGTIHVEINGIPKNDYMAGNDVFYQIQLQDTLKNFERSTEVLVYFSGKDNI